MGTTMGINYSLNHESKLLLRTMVLAVSLFNCIGCVKAEKPGVYRESLGEVAGFTAEPTDPAIRIATFARLQDGSIIHPYLYYYQITKSGPLGGTRTVEKTGRISRPIGRKLEAKYRELHLPISNEIDSYLFLLCTIYTKEIEVMGVMEKIHRRHDWQLWEVSAKEVSPDKPIAFPGYKELQERTLSEESEALRESLVDEYAKLSAAGRRKAFTPVGQEPMDCEAPREPGTYLKGCGEIKSVRTKVTDTVVQVARFVELSDGSVHMPKLKYFWYVRKAKEKEFALQILRADRRYNGSLDLPVSKDIKKHLLLIRTPVSQDIDPDSLLGSESNHLEEADFLGIEEWTPWELIELPSEYIRYTTKSIALRIPSCEELATRELSDEKQELLDDLVAKYNKKRAAAKSDFNEPLSQSDRTLKTQ